jgi:radical SAM superfamily enzyme YgiQ (UPF0313 family)
MRALLVYPKMPTTMWNMETLAQVRGKKTVYPPLGLLTVAALLPQQWQLRLVDENIRSLTEQDFIGVDLVFISAMNVQKTNVNELITRCRIHPVTLIAGGPLFTHEHEQFPDIDHFVLNEAELTLPPFLEDLQSGNAKRLYQTDQFADLRTSPIPRWDLVNPRDYLFGIVQYSRGCPFQCDFCDVTALFGHTQRTKTSQQIVAELSAMGSLDAFDALLFADDNIIGNRHTLKTALLPEIISWRQNQKRNITLATQVSINLADDPQLMELMLQAGFRNIFVGIETPSEEALENCGKAQNLKRNLLDDVKKLHAAGFIISGGFIVGFDSDTPDIFQRQFDFIQRSGIIIPTVNLLKAPYCTQLYQRMHSENRLIELLDFDENKMNIIPRMPIKELYQGYQRLLEKIYAPKYIYQRGIRFLQLFAQSQMQSPIRHTVKLRDLITLWRVILRIGVFHASSVYFWKLFAWVVLYQPGNLRAAFLFGVIMHHDHELYRKFNRFMKSQEYQAFIEMAAERQRELAP